MTAAISNIQNGFAPSPLAAHDLFSTLEAMASFLSLSSIGDDSTDENAADGQVISAILGGDREAFGSIVGKYQRTISRQMMRFSPEPAIVEELVHDVFVEAYLSLRSFRGRSPLVHWLRKIAVRVGYRYWKLRARDKARQESLAGDSADILAILLSGTSTTSEESELWLHDLLDLLAPRDRVVLMLKYWEGHTVAEIAKLLGWSRAMVKVQSYRARKRLKKLIAEASP